MEGILVVSLVIAGLGLLANGDVCEATYEACETGDWETMADSAEEKHGERIGYPWNVNSKGR